MIAIEEIAEVVQAYLDRYGDERVRLAPLLAGLAAHRAVTSPAVTSRSVTSRSVTSRSVTSRSTFSGHVTCSVVLSDPAGQVLHIRHNVLRRWLRPGGHLAAADTSLLGAALRELEEETGIGAGDLTALDTLPLDIDVHPIPANPAKGEPAHQHFDLRYALSVTGTPVVRLQTDEVNDFAWVPLDGLEPNAVREKLSHLRGVARSG